MPAGILKNQMFGKTSAQMDEYYTQEKDVRTIAANLKQGLRIWCPFDNEHSYFPKVLKEFGFEVAATCTDFFTTHPPENVNAIVSNPPFSCKRQILERCKALNIPFALILPSLFVADGVPLDYGHQIIMFRKRMKFMIDWEGTTLNRPLSNCCVWSNGLLKNDFTIVR